MIKITDSAAAQIRVANNNPDVRLDIGGANGWDLVNGKAMCVLVTARTGLKWV